VQSESERVRCSSASCVVMLASAQNGVDLWNRVHACRPRGIHLTAVYGEVAYLKLEAESPRMRDM